jgi:hypothetical protein
LSNTDCRYNFPPISNDYAIKKISSSHRLQTSTSSQWKEPLSWVLNFLFYTIFQWIKKILVIVKALKLLSFDSQSFCMKSKIEQIYNTNILSLYTFYWNCLKNIKLSNLTLKLMDKLCKISSFKCKVLFHSIIYSRIWYILLKI